MRRVVVVALALGALACESPTVAGTASAGDGQLYFLRSSGGAPDALFVASGSAFATRPVVAGPLDVTSRPAVSLDGRWLAWRDMVPRTYPLVNEYRIFVRERRSGVVTQVLEAGEIGAYPSWSADGSRLLIASRDPYDGQGGVERLVSMAPDGSDRRVELPPDAPVGGMPALSPSGAEVAWVVSSASGSRLERVVLATNLRVALTPEGAPLADPAWSADGREIVYASYGGFTSLDEPRRVHIVSREGVAIQALDLPGLVGRPVFSPDGERVAVCREIPAGAGSPARREVVVWERATGQLQVLTAAFQSDCFPTWGR